MEESRNTMKEKIGNFVSSCKNVCVSSCGALLQKGTDNKSGIFKTLIAILVLGAVGTGSFYLVDWFKFKDESPTFSTIRKSELAGTSEVGSKFVMGDLEITVHEVTEGSYRPLELDAQGNRITRNYLSANVTVFNTGYADKSFLLFGLEDGKGGQYERDVDVEFYMKELKDFGPAKEIYSRTIREGHLNFLAPDAEAKDLQLIILNETANKKVIYNIKR